MALSNDIDSLVKIKCFGVGGGGSNAVSRMAKEASPGVEYVGVNTDAQALARMDTPIRLRIGDQLTRGLGAGGNPEIGMKAAEESRDDIYESVKGADMVFVAAGMGGGTGTGAAPVIAQVAKETGALTIGIVTRPFAFEGSRRARQAEEGIARLKDAVDSLIIVPNERLLAVAGQDASWQDAFRLADDVLRQGVHAISELVTIPGEINLDFADVRNVMSNSGQALMAIGHGRGSSRAIDAAKQAIANPLLEVDITGAKGVLFNISAGADLALAEIHAAADVIAQSVDPDANIIFGVVPDPKSDGEVRLTLIATGFQTTEQGMMEDDRVVDQILREALGDADLDLPPFLRRKSRRLAR
jgi:cell division protein FtsZ